MTRKKHRTNDTGPLRAVAYVRLSRHKAGEGRDEHRNTDVGLDTQRAGCERAITALGGSIVVVEQDVLGGDRLDRPGLWRAIDRIKAGQASCLVVYALDRLGRDQVQQGVIVHALRSAGGRLLSVTENVEEGAHGDFIRTVHGYAAAVELEKNRERTGRAIDAKFRQAARYKPSQRAPYGYRRVGSGEGAMYAIDPLESSIVRRIFTERAAGASVRSIVLGLRRDGIPTPSGRGQWGTKTLDNILSRQVYATGEHECWRTQTVRDANGVPLVEPRPPEDRYVVAFPPFLDPSLLDRARATAERNVWRSRRDDRPAEYGIGRYGYFRCLGCGRALSVCGRLKGSAQYVCTHHKHSTKPCPAPACITVETLDGPVWQWVMRIIEDPGNARHFRVEPQIDTPDAMSARSPTSKRRRPRLHAISR
jgi:site-specific DNA recombinase